MEAVTIITNTRLPAWSSCLINIYTHKGGGMAGLIVVHLIVVFQNSLTMFGLCQFIAIGNRHGSARSTPATGRSITSLASSSSSPSSDVTSIWSHQWPIALVTSTMSYLSVYEIFRMTRICRTWRSSIMDDGHWRRLFIKQFGELQFNNIAIIPSWSLPSSWLTPSSPSSSSTSKVTSSATSPRGSIPPNAGSIASSSDVSISSYHHYRRRWRAEMGWNRGFGIDRVPPAHDLTPSSTSNTSTMKHDNNDNSSNQRVVGAVDHWDGGGVKGTRITNVDQHHASSLVMDQRIIVTGGFKGGLAVWNIAQGIVRPLYPLSSRLDMT
jgi:hypothetical protein